MDWCEISVRVAASDAEAVAAALEPLSDGSLAIDLPFSQSSLEAPPTVDSQGEAVVRLYFATSYLDEGVDSERLDEANALLGPWGIRATLRRIPDEDWQDGWKQHFGILRVGKRLVIRPLWLPYEGQPGDIVVDLDPGIAFGTGDHPTTRACLEFIERHLQEGDTMLDLGCGSGILSIAAAKLGAGHVWALDLDPFAVDAAVANVGANGLEGQVVARCGSLGSADVPGMPPAFDLIAANIASSPLIELAPQLAGRLSPDGSLVASGIIAERIEDVRIAFANAGLRVDDVLTDGEWRTLLVRRTA